MNPRLLLSLVVAACFPLAAVAQSGGPGGVNIDLNGPGGGVHVDVHDQDAPGNAGVHVRADAHQEIRVDQPGEAYRLTYDATRHGRTRFKVLAPEGLRIHVTDGWSEVVTDTIPVSFTARNGHYYRIQIFGHHHRKVFDKKIEARGGMLARLWVRPRPRGATQVSVNAGGTSVTTGGAAVDTSGGQVGVYAGGQVGVYAGGGQVAVNVGGAPPPAPAPAPAPVAAPPPAPAPVPAAGPGCMSDDDLHSLEQALKGEDFSDGKLTVLGDFARGHAFCVSQVVTVLGTLDFSEGKLKALRIMKPQIVDPQNDYRIYGAFDFDADKVKAKKILAR